MKDCGSCAICCKFLEIPILSKPQDTWCPHCKIGKYHSCGIYEKRPADCVNFNCFWKAEEWYDWLRPDRSKVLFEALPGVETVMVSTDQSRPDAWKKKKIVAVIEKLRKKGRPVIVRTKNDTKFALPKGWTQARVMADLKTVLDRRK
jgi:hypothetical protein